jgi:hypothetical protein
VIFSMGYTKVGIKMGLYTRKLMPVHINFQFNAEQSEIPYMMCFLALLMFSHGLHFDSLIV